MAARRFSTIALLTALAMPAVGYSAEIGAVLTGFHMSWEKRPHRLNQISFGAIAQSHDSSTAQLSCQLKAKMIGGTWADGSVASDGLRTQLPMMAMTTRQGSIQTADVGMLVLSESKSASAIAEKSIEIEIPLNAEFPPGTPVAAYLSSFEYDTSLTHEVGYTLNRIYMKLDFARLSPSGTSVLARWTAGIAAGPVPDRAQRLDTYGAEIKARVTAVAISGSNVKSGSVSGVTTQKAGLGKKPDFTEAMVRSLTVARPGFEHSTVYGLTGFDFDVKSEGKFHGRYLRAVDLHPGSLTSDGLSYQLPVSLYLSNDGEVTRRLRYRASASYSFIFAPTAIELRSGSTTWNAEGATLDREETLTVDLR